ncbi:hypothetical protein E3W66_01350 [Gammaproteobacteria bacterium LSUCC0057]|uniref:Uncharacterized protein n=1 Tax=Gammaproteobacteria bacterium LSUCC0057 TaxID=2559237 RepID=A0A4Y8UIH5_9GAMM|nr:hypothetical protein E3W66_01350 [Gammaproteobacteria bacterium LSUCC0057]
MKVIKAVNTQSNLALLTSRRVSRQLIWSLEHCQQGRWQVVLNTIQPIDADPLVNSYIKIVPAENDIDQARHIYNLISQPLRAQGLRLEKLTAVNTKRFNEYHLQIITEREWDCLIGRYFGESPKQTAKRRAVADRTISTQLDSAKLKLGLTSLAPYLLGRLITTRETLELAINGGDQWATNALAADSPDRGGGGGGGKNPKKASRHAKNPPAKQA